MATSVLFQYGCYIFSALRCFLMLPLLQHLMCLNYRYKLGVMSGVVDDMA